MGHQQLHWNPLRKLGQSSHFCRVCSNLHSLIRKYGLNMCHQCLHLYTKDTGLIKLD
ncbi:small ribosomal subunit protein uS14-like [Diceros bicornis minor]|uniref:small ribosomal subunit protein uS14-like n=1 Tax=Diceros bicornis minor TaxID=77932 RepID=UPI0026F0D827|nr:small ribosomal subunit protein uS14-like [Diceros bicornis minor]